MIDEDELMAVFNEIDKEKNKKKLLGQVARAAVVQ